MQITGPALPGYRTYEYLLVLSPHEDLRKRIMQSKKEFSEKYGVGNSGGITYLALVGFTQYEMMEERILIA